MCTGGCVMTQFRLIKHEWPLGGNNGDQWPPILKIQKIMCRPYSKESLVKRWTLYVLWGLRNDSITADRPYYCPPFIKIFLKKSVSWLFIVLSYNIFWSNVNLPPTPIWLVSSFYNVFYLDQIVIGMSYFVLILMMKIFARIPKKLQNL